MSESSSDTESSCGWIVISNEGSDIETLGPDIGADYDPKEAAGASALEQPASSQVEDVEAVEQSCLDVTIKEGEETVLEAQPGQQAGKEAGLEDHVHHCSSSDHSDIVTLGNSREAELGVWEEPPAREDEDTGNEELYMGTSCSSQYTFSAAETIFPAEHVARRGSTSTEDEDSETKASTGTGTGTGTVRRRRLRKNTTGSDPEEQVEKQEDGDDGQEEVVEEAEEQREACVQQQRLNGGTLNKCVLLALVIAISMGAGHFYGTVQTQERQRLVEIRANELSDFGKDVVESLRNDLEEMQVLVISPTGNMDKITKENGHLWAREAEVAQRQDLLTQLQQAKSKMDSQQKHLASENLALKSTLEQEEASVLALQDELWHLRAQIHELKEKGAGTDSILSEKQRLNDHLLEEKQRIRSYLDQKEALMAEAQVLRKELDKERKVTDKLKEELDELRQRGTGMQGEDTETEELQARLQELERKLSFEQQRSDLWERLYVESKEDRAKGDTQPKTRKSKEGMLGKVKETFDAVKNSTKEFVHHHKEQLKKAKEAVKENIRKFSDSVKSTFKHLKDSSSNVFQRIRKPLDRRFNEKTKQQESFNKQQDKSLEEEHWPHQRPLHQHPRKSTVDPSFQADRNMRKPGAQKQQRTMGCKAVPKGCTGVFDCAYQESMSLFNKAMEPIRADEFHQLLRSYLKQEVGHFHHWRELDTFINRFFQNGLFIHDQMLFTDFVSGVEDYLVDMDEYQDEDDFEHLDDYIYMHFFGKTYSEQNGQNYPSRPFEGPGSKVTSEREYQRQQKHQRKQQHSRSLPSRDRKWARSGRSSDRHFAEVKIELGPMPFDPKY